MADRPILFSGPMVRALLDGRKSQTRRIVNVAKYAETLAGYSSTGRLVNYNGDHRVGLEFASDTHGLWNQNTNPEGRSGWCVPIPYAVGDRLWVREAHTLLPRTAYRGSVGTGTIEQVEHPTDGYTAAVFREGFDRSGKPRWRPSIHMPRWASRLTLIVTDVRVQRLQEISIEDAIAEGISGELDNGHTRVSQFKALWDSLNADRGYGWKANPWIVAISFDVIKANIDSLSREAA